MITENTTESSAPNDENQKQVIRPKSNEFFSAEDSETLAKSTLAVVEFLKENNFDCVLVTGSSRLILRSLLTGLDLGKIEVATLDHNENAQLYMRPQLEPISERRRAQTAANGPHSKVLDASYYQEKAENLKQTLLEKGIDLSGKSLAVLDDHIGSGYKAREYLQILSNFAGLTNFAFLVLIGPQNRERINAVLGNQNTSRIHFFGEANSQHFDSARFAQVRGADSQVLEKRPDSDLEVSRRNRNQMRDTIKSIREKIKNILTQKK